MAPLIRLARGDELRALQAIEDDAGLRFAALGMHPGGDPDADFDGLTLDALGAGLDQGLLFVAEEGDTCGFALCQAFPEALHLRELDVARAFQGRGIGTALVEHVCAHARALGLPQVTLTTWRDVPFNAPYYAHLGFVGVPEGAQPVWLRAIRAHEVELGLDAWPRLAMARAVSG